MKKKKIVYVALVGDDLNDGHKNILKVASKYGQIIIGLMTDKAALEYTELPHFSYKEREKFLKKNSLIKFIVPQDTLDFTKNLRKYKPNVVVHGDDWKFGHQKKIRNKVIKELKKWSGKLVEVRYTANIPKSADNLKFLSHSTTAELRKSKLKRLLKSKKIVKILEAHNPIGGLLIDNLFYSDEKKFDQIDGVWCSSLTDSTSRGKPDNGSLDLTTRSNWLSEMFEVSSKPVIFDADNGGPKEHLKFLVNKLEKIGVSAVVIEDKIGVKINSLFKDQSHTKQDTINNFCKKIKIMCNSRVSNDFLIISRIESLILGKGIKDALKRANSYSKAGADMILIHSNKKKPIEIFKFAKQFKKSKYFKPLVAVPSTYPSVTDANLIRHGFKIVIYANHLLRTSYLSMKKTLISILKNGQALKAQKDMISIKEIIQMIR